MKYIITETQFDKLLDLYLKKYIGKNSEVEREDNEYAKGNYSLYINSKGNRLMTYIFNPEGESWDDPSDTIYPENGSLYVKSFLVNDLVNFFNIRKSKVLDLLGDWFTKKYKVNVDDIISQDR
jgi:hypothetical protein